MQMITHKLFKSNIEKGTRRKEDHNQKRRYKPSQQANINLHLPPRHRQGESGWKLRNGMLRKQTRMCKSNSRCFLTEEISTKFPSIPSLTNSDKMANCSLIKAKDFAKSFHIFEMLK